MGRGDLWRRARRIFEAALDLEPETRLAFVAGQCGDDAELRAEVESLFDAFDPDDRRFESPVIGATALIDANRSEPPDERVGTVLDGLYQIEAFVARGGMGTIYRARHTLLADRVAIKIINPPWGRDAAWLRRFRHEGMAARRFRHPNAVAVYDLRTSTDGTTYLVLEYVEGRTLRDGLRRRGRFSLPEALEVLTPMAGALDAAHAAGVVHRDVKPDNVMLGAGEPPLVKILDFGIAKLAEESEAPAGSRSWIGTPSYMSPEQWGEPASDGRPGVEGTADVYALGVIAFELLLGSRPFFSADIEELRRMHVEQPPPLLHHVADVPEGVSRALACAMEKDRSHRYPTAGQFVEALRYAINMDSEATRLLVDVSTAGPAPDTGVSGNETAAEAPTNLPFRATSFVGRDEEVAELRRLLQTERLVTLVGPGGIGKTRLALETAAAATSAFPHGVWFVELAGPASAASVPAAVAAAAGVKEEAGRPLEETLATWFESRRVLVVLDNCEHAIDACSALAARLVRSSDGARMIATSREPLGVAGERMLRVQRLGLPEDDAIADAPAVRLFVERARLFRPGFAVTAAEAPAVARLVRRVEGIPLAIELAAARLKVLAVDDLARRLDERFDLLAGGARAAPPRHQTLRAAIDWSYDLLDDEERRLLRRLAVFAGGWTLEMAEEVAGGADRDAVLDVTSRLVDKSLVEAAEVAGEVRFRMLEPTRAYAHEKLMESGEQSAMLDRLCRWAARLAEEGDRNLVGAGQSHWLARFDREHDNLRLALAHSLDHDPAGCLRLCGTLGRYWPARGRLTEGRGWIEAALDRAPSAPPGDRAKALRRLAFTLNLQSEFVRATAALRLAVPLAREDGDDGEVALTLGLLGHVLLMSGDAESAREPFEESLLHARKAGDLLATTSALNNLGALALNAGRFGEAVSWCEEALVLQRRARDPWALAHVLHQLANAHYNLGDAARARELLQESLDVTTELGYRLMAGLTLALLAAVALDSGDAAESVHLLERAAAEVREPSSDHGKVAVVEGLARVAAVLGRAGDAVAIEAAARLARRDLGWPAQSFERAAVERHLRAAGESLGPERVAEAEREGATMSLDAALVRGLEAARGAMDS